MEVMKAIYFNGCTVHCDPDTDTYAAIGSRLTGVGPYAVDCDPNIVSVPW